MVRTQKSDMSHPYGPQRLDSQAILQGTGSLNEFSVYFRVS